MKWTMYSIKCTNEEYKKKYLGRKAPRRLFFLICSNKLKVKRTFGLRRFNWKEQGGDLLLLSGVLGVRN